MGGSFTSIGDSTRNYIAAIDVVTGTATSWNPNTSADFFCGVYALAISSNTIYVGGWFTSIGDSTRSNIAAIDATTGKATNWNPNADDAVSALAISSNIVYAGGTFTSIGGSTRNNIAALDATTGKATNWNPNADNEVCALAISSNVVYAGGRFTSIGSSARNYIAAINVTTGR